MLYQKNIFINKLKLCLLDLSQMFKKISIDKILIKYGGSGGTAPGAFCNFYLHLRKETVFPALHITQNCSVNVDVSFLENWQFNRKLACPHYCKMD